MKDKALLAESAQLLGQELSLQPIDQKLLNHQSLLEQVKKLVQEYLNHDMNTLLNLLYRIDISESLVKEILSVEEPGKMAEKLAEAIIERTYQKAETRIRYRE